MEGLEDDEEFCLVKRILGKAVWCRLAEFCLTFCGFCTNDILLSLAVRPETTCGELQMTAMRRRAIPPKPNPAHGVSPLKNIAVSSWKTSVLLGRHLSRTICMSPTVIQYDYVKFQVSAMVVNFFSQVRLRGIGSGFLEGSDGTEAWIVGI